jgi:hypothetical protein
MRVLFLVVGGFFIDNVRGGQLKFSKKGFAAKRSCYFWVFRGDDD